MPLAVRPRLRAFAADNPDPRTTAFRKAYMAAYPDSRPDAFAALGYDTARLLITAIAEAGSDDPARVRAALGAIGGFDGVTGTLGYRGGSRVPLKEVAIVGVAGGGLRLTRRTMPDSVPAP